MISFIVNVCCVFLIRIVISGSARVFGLKMWLMDSVHYKLISIVWRVTIYHLITPPFAWKRIAHKQPNGLAEPERRIAVLCADVYNRSWRRSGLVKVLPAIFLTVGKTHNPAKTLSTGFVLQTGRASAFTARKRTLLLAVDMPKSFLVKNKKGRVNGSSSLSGDEEGKATEEHSLGETEFLLLLGPNITQLYSATPLQTFAFGRRHRYKLSFGL